MSHTETIVDTRSDSELISGSETSSDAEMDDDGRPLKRTACVSSLSRVEDGKW